MCSIFAEKASQNIERLEWLDKFFKLMLLVLVTVYIVIGYFSVQHYNQCNNLFYIVTELIDCIVSLIFVAIGWQISNHAQNNIIER